MMSLRRIALMSVFVLGAASLLRAADMTPQPPVKSSAPKAAPAPKLSDYEKIQDMHEYHKRMVNKIEEYMRDRAKIPAEYAGPADREFIRKAKMERMRDRGPKPAVKK